MIILSRVGLAGHIASTRKRKMHTAVKSKDPHGNRPLTGLS
jgi:hypothetical protein